MADVVYRPEALADVKEIYSYVAEASQSHQTAQQFVERIMVRCRKLGIAPQAGRLRNDLYPGLRIMPFEKSTVIAYLLEEHQVVITNVFYGKRDYETLCRHIS